MVNVRIYLKQEHNAKELVQLLLENKLIASASIDQNNVLYNLENNEVTEHIYTVITSQSKSLLFKDIVEKVESHLGEQPPIHCTPIVASNKVFDDSIRSKTKKI
jgi:uncharacterized protein involved in tolerance to divalent cations